MNNPWDVQLMLNNPFNGRGELVENEGSATETEREDHIEEIQSFPFHPEKFPIRGMDRDVTKG